MYYLRYAKTGEIHVVPKGEEDSSICPRRSNWLDDDTNCYDPVDLPLLSTVDQVLSDLEIDTNHIDDIKRSLNRNGYDQAIDKIHINAKSMTKPRSDKSLSANHIIVLHMIYNKEEWSQINNKKLPPALDQFLLNKKITNTNQFKKEFKQIKFCDSCMSRL